MSRRDRHDVIVVGAGVVGAAAALRLAREGLRVAVVEVHEPAAWREEAPDLKVYAFAPDAQALLDSLDVWASVASARAHPYRRMRVWDAAGGDELRFDADQLGRANLGHIVEHQLLVDRLWSAVQRENGVERFCPERVDSLAQGEQGVELGLKSGATLRARFLLGADGAASKVRELAGIAVREHDYHQQGLVAYVQTELLHEDTAWQRFLPGGPLAFLPCTDGRCSIVWTLPQDEAQRVLAAEDASFRAELTRAFDARLGDVLAVSERKAFPLRRRLAEPMLQGRVALIGDAAHAVHPLAGQGVNLGLRDVRALGELLGEGRNFDSPDHWQRWARNRSSENAVAARSFEAINGLFSNDAPLPTLLRGPLLGMAGKLPPLTRFLWRRAAGL